MSTPRERWKPAPGYESAYEISSLGRVNSLIARTNFRRGETGGHILTPIMTNHGYLRVNLRGDHVLVARLVAKAFVPPYEGEVVAHKNGDKADNRATNLKWSTKAAVTTERWKRWRRTK